MGNTAEPIVMGWKLFQAAIVFLVMAANFHWQVTQDLFFVFVYGGMLAYGATWLLLRLHDWHAQWKRRRIRQEQQRLHQVDR